MSTASPIGTPVGCKRVVTLKKSTRRAFKSKTDDAVLKEQFSLAFLGSYADYHIAKTMASPNDEGDLVSAVFELIDIYL